jgi:molybdate transport system permease protein
LVAIVVRAPPGPAYVSSLALDALRVSAITNLVAIVIILLVGTPAAYLLATKGFRARRVLITLVEIPLVLPPVVAGIGLLVAFGRAGLFGAQVSALGLQVPFSRIAVVLAVTFVAGPFYVRGAVAAFEAVDRGLTDAARTLGAGHWRTFSRVGVPLAATGLGASAAMAFARGIGEFGATIMFAGSLQGYTQTLPLAIFAEFQGDTDRALAVGGLLVTFSVVLLAAVKLAVRGRRRARA